MNGFKNGIRAAAEMMAISARTAPKARGEDFIEIDLLMDDRLGSLANAMIGHGEKEDDQMWVRDGKCVQASAGVLLIGTRDPKDDQDPARSPVGEDVFAKSERVKRYIDLGIALGSAAKTAGILNLDNRIMWRAGEMARRTGIIDALIVIAIPFSVSGKNIYFDR